MSKIENTFSWGGSTKNVAALEQKVNQLEQNVQQLTNSNQQLQNSIQQLEQNVQQITPQLQQIGQQLQAINAQLPNFARFDRDNDWVPQTFSFPRANLSFVQDNNANFLEWKKSTNDRRGYVGMGRSNQDVIDVWGKNGARIISLNNDLELIPAGNINCSNKPLTNIGAPLDENSAINWSYVNSRIRTIEGDWRDFANLKTFNWPNIPNGVEKILDLKITYGARKEASLGAVTNAITQVDDTTISFSGQSVSGAIPQGAKLFATLTYISLT